MGGDGWLKQARIKVLGLGGLRSRLGLERVFRKENTAQKPQGPSTTKILQGRFDVNGKKKEDIMTGTKV